MSDMTFTSSLSGEDTDDKIIFTFSNFQTQQNIVVDIETYMGRITVPLDILAKIFMAGNQFKHCKGAIDQVVP